MQVSFREARHADVPLVLALLRDDVLGTKRETADDPAYYAAFDAMAAEPHNTLIVGEDPGGRLVATYQLTLITGLSHRGTRRA